MTDERDIRDLVGDDVGETELEELARVDAVLRAVPPPPAVPESLTRAVRAAAPTPIWTRRRTALAVAAAVAVAAFGAGVGAWLAGDSGAFRAERTVTMEATGSAAGAAALIRLGSADDDGNWTLELETEGLPELPEGGYYVLWLADDGEYAGPCGTFRAGDEETTVRMNASYRLADYDEWVVTAVRPGAAAADEPWLLRARVADPA